MGWHHGWTDGMGGFMFPGLGLIIIVLLVLAVFWAFSSGRKGLDGGPGSGSSQSENPLEILKRRYARGEITKEEYDSMKDDLRL